MLKRWTKWYFKDKYLKYDKKRAFIYEQIKSFFKLNHTYQVKNNLFYRIEDERKYLDKEEIINKYWIDFFNNLRNKKNINSWNSIYLWNSYKVRVKLKNENQIKSINLKYFFKINPNIIFWKFLWKDEVYKIKDFFLNEDELIKEIEIYSSKNKKDFEIIKKEIFFDLSIKAHINWYLFDIINDKIDLKYFTAFLDNNSKIKLFNKSEDNYLFFIKTWNKKTLLESYSKEHKEMLKYLNLKDWDIFEWKEIFKHFNKNSEMEKILSRSYYKKPAPKWYRKKENKKFKKMNQKEILIWKDLEDIQTIPYKKNDNRYW